MKHIRLTRAHVIGIAVSFGVMTGAAAPVKAATLKTQFVDSNQDRICVYTSHFRTYSVNVGFNGHCNFNVPDTIGEYQKDYMKDYQSKASIYGKDIPAIQGNDDEK